MNTLFKIVVILTLSTKFTLSDDTRIIGGIKATQDYPFIVSFQLKHEFYSDSFNLEKTYDGWSHSCGGAIVSTRHVVTAAHCVSGFKILMQQISILAGIQQLSGNGTRYYVESVLVHDNFISMRKNDIALLKTNDTIEYVPNKIQPITYSNEFIGDGVICVIMGWGYTNQNQFGISNDLLEISVKTLTNTKCRYAGIPTVGETEICAISDSKKGVCGADSGGPLVKDNLLVGVVSFGTGMCAIGYPDIYERASYHYNWLKNNTDMC